MLVHPVIATSYATALDSAVSGESTDAELPAAALEGPELLRRFALVSDGRSERGRDHPVAVVLTLCAAAVLAGMRSFTAIAGWVADVPADLLFGLQGRPAGHPSKTTLWRVLTGADAAAVDAAVGAWLTQRAAERAAPPEGGADNGADGSELVAIAVDGKTVRGALDADGNQVHLMAAATHVDSLVLGQVEVGAKTNEIPQFAPLLDGLAAAGVDVSNIVITADALHTQRGHAEHLHSIGAEFVLTAKQNQPRLFAALNALPWAQTPIAARHVDTAHGRVTTRTIQVLPAPADLPFPHVNQVWLIERYVRDPTGTLLSAVAALGITSLTPHRATPTDIATYVRDHWGIESLHWLRDTVYREDHSTARTRSGPRVMAALRNLAIGAIHLHGRRDITETTRWATRFMERSFKILKLTP
ncbi:MAG: ISAs1 family transposase [Pseudonocardiaceae bacterium]